MKITDKYIKSPLNYVGGKYKLLPQIIPLFPSNINTFVDLFGGGFNVGCNINAEKIIYNDICKQVVELLNNFYQKEFDVIHNQICNIISEYNLSRSDLYGYEYYNCNSNDGLGTYNKSGYIKLRDDYNSAPDYLKFYTLITCSFSNQIRFNSKGEFNMPYGKRDYNKSLQSKLKHFLNIINQKEISFRCGSFEDFDFSKLNNNDFVYCDPPYFSSVATYNESGGRTEQNEQTLLNLLDELNNRNICWALSNNLKYDNPLLDSWKDKYNIHYLGGDYSNCNYHKKDKSKDIEVLITNY